VARKDWRQTADVNTNLQQRPQAFSFFQAMRLLRLQSGKTSGEKLQEFYRDNLRIRPYLSLAFPPTDIQELSAETLESGEKRHRLTVNFLGLYGADSPLPTFYTEELLDEASEDKSVSRDFLDIFNNNVYSLFFQVWSKYRLMLKVVEERDEAYLERLYSLLGVGAKPLRDALPDSYRMLRYIGLFTQYPRSAMGLQTLLRDALDVEKVEVEQCALRRVTIPRDQRCRLGLAGAGLDEDAWLGEEMDDRMGKACIRIGPLSDQAFHRMLPGQEGREWAVKLIRFYLVAPLEVDLELSVKPEDVETAQPGAGKWSQLGCDTWVFAGDRMDTAHAFFPNVGDGV
jgi:type VI secretion system protein ImpH